MRELRQRLLSLVLIIFLALAGRGSRSWPASIGQQSILNILPHSALGPYIRQAIICIRIARRRRAKGYAENLGPGEWYLAGYFGYSYLPPMDWKIALNASSNELGPSAKMNYRPGVLGGIKFGRYFDSLPWFGIEGETNLSRNIIPGPGKISPSLPGLPPQVLSGKDYFLVWSMQVNVLARYGFFKDKEVTFGRLQPYVGIGPGWEVVYGTFDSTKNLAIEALGGVRYMCTDKISLFLEYKYSYQFKLEYQDVHFNGDTLDKTFIFNFPHHQFVLGVSYHFKNLWGN